MEAALARAAGHAGEGTLVWARTQSDARTRRDHEWLGYEGNLHCALIVEPDYPNEEAWQLVYVSTLAAGSAIAEMVSPMTGLRFVWPNRLLINDLLAARLDVATTDPACDPYPDLVLGVSINVAAHRAATRAGGVQLDPCDAARPVSPSSTSLKPMRATSSPGRTAGPTRGSRRYAVRGASGPTGSVRTRKSGCSTARSTAVWDRRRRRGCARPRYRIGHAARHDRGNTSAWTRAPTWDGGSPGER